MGGVCVDAVDVYDARTTAGLMLYEKACGVHLVHNFTTSANHLTVQFVSDANAVYRGFDFLYTAYYDRKSVTRATVEDWWSNGGQAWAIVMGG